MPKNQQIFENGTGARQAERQPRHNTAVFTKAADGKRAAWPGRKARMPEPSSPGQDRRQTSAYDLHVDGVPVAQIAKQLGADRGTIALDIQMEGRRRSTERAEQRKSDLTMAITRYESVIFRANQRLAELNAEGGHSERTFASRTHQARQCDMLILEAQTRIDELLGLTR